MYLNDLVPRFDSPSCPSVPILINDTYDFSRTLCWDRARDYLSYPGNSSDGTCLNRLFLNTSLQDPVLTYYGCTTFCGSHQGWNIQPDPVTRVLTWIVPTVFLLLNIDLTPIGWRKFFAIAHAIGDPVDTLWSLLDKLYAWHKCFKFAEEFVNDEGSHEVTEKDEKEHRIRVIATIFSGIEEIAGQAATLGDYYWDVASTLGLRRTTKFREWRKAALTLADNRINLFVRTWVAIALFVFQFATELIIDDDSEPPGGRLGSAMLLSWLIPMILISNILGSFGSQRTCLRTIMRLVKDVTPSNLPAPGQNLAGRWDSWDEYLDNQSNSGIIYSYRSFKFRDLLLAKGKDKWARLAMPFAATLPIIFGFLPAFYIHWYAVPVGFSCRHLWIIGVFFAWMISPFLTLAFQYMASARYSWWLVFIKDLLVGLSGISIMSLSVAGLFNSCLCWSLKIWLGEMAAYFPLNSNPIYFDYGKGIYRNVIIIFGCLHVLFVLAVLFFFRKGIWVWRWTEDHKGERWHKRETWKGLGGPWVLNLLDT